MTTAIMYEIYPKRVLVEPIDGLPLFDRCPSLKLAKPSAVAWGGVVVRVEAEILNKYPLRRRVLTWEVVYVNRARVKARPPVTHRGLMGKLRANSRTLYKKARV